MEEYRALKNVSCIYGRMEEMITSFVLTILTTN